MANTFRQKADRPTKLRSPALLRRFWRRDDGATAVEFGLVAIPFLMLLFAIIETALVFFAGQVLETAAADSGRLILTGQAQSGNFDASKFRQEVCNRTYGLFKNCESGGLIVDVQTYKSFDAIDDNKKLIDEKTKKLTLTPIYAPGGPGDIVVVRLAYQWPTYLSFMDFSLADLAGEKRLLLATSAFRNEPFPTPPPAPPSKS